MTLHYNILRLPRRRTWFLSATSHLGLIIIHIPTVDCILRNCNRPHIASHLCDSSTQYLTPSLDLVPHGFLRRRILPYFVLLQILYPHLGDSSTPLPAYDSLRNPHTDQNHCAYQSWDQNLSARLGLVAYSLAPVHILHIHIIKYMTSSQFARADEVVVGRRVYRIRYAS